MKTWNTLPKPQVLTKTVAALKENGIDAVVVQNAEEAKHKLLEMIPKGSEVMTMTSVTLDTIGASDALNNEKQYRPVRDKLYAMDKSSHAKEMNAVGAAPEFVTGSVHAVTVDGTVVIASNSGSQLPAYAYSALNVIWVVGAQKIVKNLDEAMARIYEHTLPLESDRARKAYGVDGSNVSKVLIINKEVNPSRVKMIIINEVLGY